MHFRSQVSTDCDGSLSGGGPTDSMEANSGTTGELGTRDENAIEEVSL